MQIPRSNGFKKTSVCLNVDLRAWLGRVDSCAFDACCLDVGPVSDDCDLESSMLPASDPNMPIKVLNQPYLSF